MNTRPIAGLAMTALLAGVAHAGPAVATFRIQMTVTSSCAVTLSPTAIDLGTVTTQSSAVNYNGSTTLEVNCSKKTPFYIGLAPSNGKSNGKGAMFGAQAGNGAQVPYTLYSNAALTKVWGNTATSTSRGNGVAGTGTGMAAANAVSFPVYAKVTNVNFMPDRYADTVTVSVHY
ncbi:spore coat protein U domain-containing protein [Polaromonas sp. C04]|uniref:Csu type fimbrial protein n=1 Tax=Polaromonas sp. C04 TaxID=1945857 RepID=UPI0009845BEB|nr:spore coat protein U domain-containing protein [Polaromonas sp. C04]OOG54789.1 hypothetical protein B0E49_08650 [Polaromonas sp. C04]